MPNTTLSALDQAKVAVESVAGTPANDVIALTKAAAEANPFMLALLAVMLLASLAAILLSGKNAQGTVFKMIIGAETRAVEDRAMFRDEQRLTRESHERTVAGLVASVKGLTQGVSEIATNQRKLEDEFHRFRNEP